MSIDEVSTFFLLFLIVFQESILSIGPKSLVLVRLWRLLVRWEAFSIVPLFLSFEHVFG